MFTKILTDRERRSIHGYLRRNGEKKATIRKIVNLARTNIPAIKADLELLETLVKACEHSD